MVREARPEELPSIGALRVEAYESGGFLRPGDPYAGTLRALGGRGDGTVLVAEDGGRLLGTIMLAAGAAIELAGTAGAADIRALAVAPGSQGRGVGRRLLRAAISRAAAAGVHRLLLSTQPTMRAAHSLYESEGFRRAPELDWQPVPGYTLLVYETAVPRRPGQSRRSPGGTENLVPWADAAEAPSSTASSAGGGGIFFSCRLRERSRKYRAMPIPATTRNPSTPGVTLLSDTDPLASTVLASAAAAAAVTNTPSRGPRRTDHLPAARYRRAT